ncbi:hypothetical protein EQG63_03150 [Flavobacterium amnicola]|uniref:Uncharacterized protein n=1 Tax=Flavobacterium amnicola TaxID=2506422 RepID=A0A4Q1K8P2_9FLAO|nr:hypothetical protein [Flavobacterium amnicola]RXR20949.1 hypothetical protein EQG63_03150 [Flavobacterium amnicola]
MEKVKYIFGILILFFFQDVFSNTTLFSENDPNKIVEEMIIEINRIQKNYNTEYGILHDKLLEINKKISSEITTDQKVDFIIKKDFIKSEIENLKVNTNTDISKIRYIKGLQIIKILYEKVLSLDHHFASVRTFTEINKISNPNQYPEFEKIKELITKKKDKKTGFDISSILGSNPYISVISTFTNLLVSGLSKEEKDVELQKIDCLLDFTMRMQNDLNTIYFETAFLQSSNQTIKNNLEVLFKEYTKPIGYSLGLEECRNEDDWDAVSNKLSAYIEGMKKSPPQKQLKLQIDIEFPIDRLIQFVTQYNDFINEGGKFYQKFNTILNSYENQKQCETKLPIEYKKMKEDIAVAVEKFNVAYKPVEINGSKMKEILYGINEFD